VAPHELFSEGFAAFEAGRQARWPYQIEPSCREGICYSGDERGFWANHRQVCAYLASQLGQAVNIPQVGRQARRNFGYASVARHGINSPGSVATAELPGYSVLAPARTYDHYIHLRTDTMKSCGAAIV
jgi:hypothetical protein